MPRAYTPKPCRRCGGEKRPRQYKTELPRYCGPCEVEVRKEYLAKHVPSWCETCLNHYDCSQCRENKRNRLIAGCRRRKSGSGSNYFRPFNAEKFWQQRSHAAVQVAIKRGLLPSLKGGDYACTDCPGVALEYDHRDYSRPLDVQPVCRSCNKRRGTAIWPSAEQFQFPRLKFGPAPPTQTGEVPDAA